MTGARVNEDPVINCNQTTLFQYLIHDDNSETPLIKDRKENKDLQCLIVISEVDHFSSEHLHLKQGVLTVTKVPKE